MALGAAVTHTQSRQPAEGSLGSLVQGRWAAAAALAGLCSQVRLRWADSASSTLARDVQGPPPQKAPHVPQHLLRALSGAAEAKGKMQKSELWPC